MVGLAHQMSNAMGWLIVTFDDDILDNQVNVQFSDLRGWYPNNRGSKLFNPRGGYKGKTLVSMEMLEREKFYFEKHRFMKFIYFFKIKSTFSN